MRLDYHIADNAEVPHVTVDYAHDENEEAEIIFSLPLTDENEQLAVRIVTCVNALAGIPTEALENGQIAEVIRALERIQDHESRADRRHRGMVDASEVGDLQRIARFALAKLKST